MSPPIPDMIGWLSESGWRISSRRNPDKRTTTVWAESPDRDHLLAAEVSDLYFVDTGESLMEIAGEMIQRYQQANTLPPGWVVEPWPE